MFWPLNSHYQGVRTVTDTCTYMHTYSTSVHIRCEAIYDNTGVRDVNFMLSEVEVFEVYIYSYYLANSMMTVSMVVYIHKYAFWICLCSNCYIYMYFPCMQHSLEL
jgi:hypothetical protein